MYNRIVLVTDELRTLTSADLARRDLEGNSAQATQLIKSSLEKIAKEVIHYSDIAMFTSNIDKHKHDIIFPIKYGLNSPNSKSLLPAICESNHLMYVGADCYTHNLCNDKHLSKLYAKEFGISSAKSILVRDYDRDVVLRRLSTLQLPLVVKPNFGGGSTGISINNICSDYQDAVNLIAKLINSHKIPILVEEYIQGYEIEYIIFGNKQSIRLAEEVKLIMNKQDYFEKTIWGFETKKLDDTAIDFQKSNLLSKKDKSNLQALFQSFDKIEFMRIDGRFHDGNFTLIELSPDCYLGDDCAFYYAFEQQGVKYEDMFKLLIENAQVPY